MARPVIQLTTEAVRFLAHDLAKKLMARKEPTPDFSARYPNVPESCLRVPFQTFGGKPLYRDLVEQASILFYLMIKNHPFQNGNKRIAVTSLLVFLSINGHWLTLTPRELYRFAVYVAKSDAEDKALVVAAIQAYARQHLTARADRA